MFEKGSEEKMASKSGVRDLLENCGNKSLLLRSVVYSLVADSC